MPSEGTVWKALYIKPISAVSLATDLLGSEVKVCLSISESGKETQNTGYRQQLIGNKLSTIHFQKENACLS